MTNHTFKTIPGLYLPTFSIPELEALLKSAHHFKIKHMRFTPTSQIAVAGVDDSDFPELISHLQRFMTKGDDSVTTIIACQGCGKCKCGVGDTNTVVQRIKELNFNGPLPAKCKIAIAGCSRCCTMPFVRDIGLIPSTQGWKLIFGGNGGGNPRIGDVIAEKVQEHDLVELVHKCLHVYRKHGHPKQRTSRFIEEFGVERFKEEIFTK